MSRGYTMGFLYKTLTRRRILTLAMAIGIYVLYCICPRVWDWTKLDPPGVIVRKVGGLGNQLFIYACMYSVSKKMNIPLYLEIESSKILQPQADIFYNVDKRPYVMHKFGIVYDKAVEGWYTSDWPLDFLTVLTLRDHDLLNQELKPLPKNKLLILDDYCQSEIFFKDYAEEIKRMFQLQMTVDELKRPPFRRWIDRIADAGENSVAIHIRRGDYTNRESDESNENYWFTPISFYHKSIHIMLEKLDLSRNVSFFVFSDDVGHIKEELLRGLELPKNVHIHFVSCNGCTTSLEDFYLMTICKHIINGNSTFSWWAAYLLKNAKKIVIAPLFHPKTLGIYSTKEERKFKEYELTLFYPKEWIVLDPFNYNREVS